jgi:[ribosomal protein S18]-alanine N-acetyltransferase
MQNIEKSLEFGIRNCTMDDIPSVMDINETTLPENYPLFFYEQILDKYSEAFSLAYLKNDPEKIIGYIMWRVERGPSSFGLDYVKKGHLVSLAVLPSYRRQGVAHGLLSKSMEIVIDYKISEYVLEVRVSNTGANNLYGKLHGFERAKILEHYYRDGEDAFYMSHLYDPNGKYEVGSTGMTDNDIIKHYENNKYMIYRCPKCEQLYIKSLKFSLPGSIDPNDTAEILCSECFQKMRCYDISQGLYDIKE